MSRSPRALRSPWPLGASIVLLSFIQYVATPRYDEELVRLTGGAVDPETVSSIVTAVTATTILVTLCSFLWLVFWKFPSEVHLFAWCKERFGRSLLWSLLLGGSALFSLWDAATDLSASHFLGAACDLGWAVCLFFVRAVVVSRLVAESRSRAASR